MPTFTLSQLQTLVWGSLDNNQGLYPADNVRRVLNQGLMRLNCLVGFQQDVLPVVPPTDGSLIYTFPVGLLIPTTVYCEGQQLEKVRLRRLASNYRTWATDTSTRYGPPARWAAIDLRRFIVHPLDLSGGSLLEAGGIIPITPLVNPDDPITLEDQHSEILVNYARSRVMIKEGGKPFAQASMAYQEMIRQVKEITLWKGLVFPRYYLLPPDAQEQPK